MSRSPLLLAILLCACAESAPGGHTAADAAPRDALPPPPDVMAPPDAAPGKDFGDPCHDNRECRSGYCIETPEAGRICTRACGACPDGYECRPIDNGGADRLFLCLPRQPDLCKPCTDDRDCDGSRCLDFGRNHYCGADCADGGACPAGYECADVDGSKQCVPTGGHGCQGCLDRDGDGYGEGADCTGFDCDDGDPDTHVGATEVCDDKDNDCNALVDDAPRGAPDTPCLAAGVCAGAHLACIAGGWRCNYPDTYEAGDETRCDGLDDDCDGQTDEHLLGTPDNCSFCGQRCAFPHAAGLCADGACERGDCEPGWNDADGNDGNGCEYGCNPTRDGVEVCDQIDNDCDGHTDEGFDTQRDPSHCGACGHVCAYPHGVPACAGGACALMGCEAGWVNANGRDDDGCELPCVPTGDEVCDQIDDDCDGHTDEGFDTTSDATNCGQCGHVCQFANAAAECRDGQCVAGACADGFHDADGQPGCEYACNPTRGGVEACDQIDNDCDGRTDEDFDLTSDASHCGACDRACGFANGVAECRAGECALAGCQAGFVDLDGPANGCEYACTPTGDERCNGADDDCDGHADEGFDLLNDAAHCGGCGRLCAPENAAGLCIAGECAIGQCMPGFYDLDGHADDGCEYACVPQNGGVETCNGVDDDCDGHVDEDFDLQTDASNCGRCGHGCDLLNAESACQGGECAQVRCLDGFVDLDGDGGCEYACAPRNGSVEVCNRADDDCDGQADEGTLNRCGGCGPEPAEVCNGLDDDCDGQTDEGTLNRCGGCGPEPAEVCNGADDDCDGVVDDHGVCGPYVQQQCRVFFGWGDNRQGPVTPADFWGNCPAVDRYTTDNVRCTGTRRDGNYALMQFHGDVDDNDRVALMFQCGDGANPGLAAYVQSHCAVFLGHADEQRGPDNTPVWGPCPAGVRGDDGFLRCTSSGFDGRFHDVTLTGDVDDNDDFAVAWICRDDADPGRAAALQRSVDVFLGWADLTSGIDGVATWAGCPPNDSAVSGRLACVGSRGDGLFHRLWIGAFDGNVDDNDQIAWALRALAAP